MNHDIIPACDYLGDKARSDGWLPNRQRVFLAHLADHGIVSHAAAAAGMGLSGAYALRRRHDAMGFAIGWKAAMLIARDRLFDEHMERAFLGETHTTVKDGETTHRTRRNYRLGLGMIEKIDRDAVPPEVAVAQRYFDYLLEIVGEGGDDEVWRDYFLTLGENSHDWHRHIANLFPLPEESAENDVSEFAVWEDAEGEPRCDYPPPADFDGFEQGVFGEDGYERSLTAEELAAHQRDKAERDASHIDEIEEMRARGHAERAAWLAGTSPADPGALESGLEAAFETAELPDYEVKSLDGLPARNRPGARGPEFSPARRPNREPHPARFGLAPAPAALHRAPGKRGRG